MAAVQVLVSKFTFLQMINKIRSILVDDEQHCREVLRNLLNTYFPSIEVVGEADSVERAYELITATEPQLVFLDIQMPRQSGFSLLKKFDEVPFEIIFVTSFDRYAINAIKFSALDYLLKPVMVKDLEEAVLKASRTIEKRSGPGIQVINLLKSIHDDSNRKIAVHARDHVKLLNPADILYIEADGRYCFVTTANNERYSTAKLLKEFEEWFGETSDFVRIHKSILVNCRHIQAYSKGEPCTITMTNLRSFEIARRKKTEILEMISGRR